MQIREVKWLVLKNEALGFPVRSRENDRKTCTVYNPSEASKRKAQVQGLSQFGAV